MPNRSEWEKLQEQYKQACEKFLSDPDSDDDVQIISGDDDEKSQTAVDRQPVLVESNVGGDSVEASADNSSGDKNGEQQIQIDTAVDGEALSTVAADDEPMKAEETTQVEDGGADESAMPIVIVATVISSFFVWIIHKNSFFFLLPFHLPTLIAKSI